MTIPTMPMGRRTLLAGAAAVLALLALPSLPAWADDAAAEGYIKQFAGQLTTIVNGAQPQSAKKAALTPVVDANVDVGEIARFCLGRFWRTATPAQQQKFVSVFHRVMLNSIDDHLGEYVGVDIAVNGSSPQGGNAVVHTTITRPNKPAAAVDWVISSTTGSPKVIDLIAEGASLRIQQRSDYASYLSQNNNNVDALVEALERKLNEG